MANFSDKQLWQGPRVCRVKNQFIFATRSRIRRLSQTPAAFKWLLLVAAVKLLEAFARALRNRTKLKTAQKPLQFTCSFLALLCKSSVINDLSLFSVSDVTCQVYQPHLQTLLLSYRLYFPGANFIFLPRHSRQAAHARHHFLKFAHFLHHLLHLGETVEHVVDF
jgi:hypothetical protein